MNSFQILNTVFSYLVPLISVALSYFLGYMQANRITKSSVKREQYDNFYSQYAKRIYAGMTWNYKYSTMSIESRSVFFDLIMKNLSYTNEKIVDYIPHFYCCFLNFLDDEENIKVQDDLDDAFNTITVQILSQASKLSKELKLTDFSKFALEQYLQLNKK